MVYMTYCSGIMIITGSVKGVGMYKQSPFVDGRIIWITKH